MYHNNQPYGEKLVAAVNDQKQATFNLRLVTSQTYDFVFWADKANGNIPADFTDLHYNTENLTAITVKSYSGNNDEFDAFTAVEKGYKVEGAFTKDITLKRPFGQLNVKTLDLDDVPADLQPNKVKVTFQDVPSSFNAWTGRVSEKTAPVEYTANLLCNGTENVVKGELTVDYIWAESAENASIVNFSMAFLKEDGSEVSKNDAFTNIPIRRNYRTNVSGNLLTKQGSFNVTVDPTFEKPDIDAVVQEVSTATDITEAIENGARNIVVKTAPTQEVTIQIPHTLTPEQAAEKVTITLPKTDQNITINYTTNQDGKATQEIELFVETTAKLTLNLPKSTVILRGSVGELDATTAPNTLVIPEGITVGKLTVKQGNVEVYGTVNELVSRPATSILTLHISTAEKLFKIAEMAKPDNGKSFFSNAIIQLDADIDLSSKNWEPVNMFSASNFTFDGQGHTISNMKAINKLKYGNGFFSNLVGKAWIKNVTFQNATVQYDRFGSFAGNVYGIVSGYTYGTVTFENVHVKGSEIYGFGKVGGLIGMAADKGGITTIKNCSVADTKVGCCYNGGGLIGLSLNKVSLEASETTNVKWIQDFSHKNKFVTLDTTLKDKEGKTIAVKGIYWKYDDTWYYGAWGDYYIDQDYMDFEIASGGQLADGLCHNK